MPRELTAGEAAALVEPTDTLGSGLGPAWPPALMLALGERDDWESLTVDGALVTVGWNKGEEGLTIKASKGQAAPMPKEPVVLVVDDNQGLLAWLEQELKAAGVKPAIAASLEDANKILGKTRPDAALVDVMLPDGNGVHLAVHLRKQFGKLPVIVMSGYSRRELSERSAASSILAAMRMDANRRTDAWP